MSAASVFPLDCLSLVARFLPIREAVIIYARLCRGMKKRLESLPLVNIDFFWMNNEYYHRSSERKSGIGRVVNVTVSTDDVSLQQEMVSIAPGVEKMTLHIVKDCQFTLPLSLHSIHIIYGWPTVLLSHFPNSVHTLILDHHGFSRPDLSGFPGVKHLTVPYYPSEKFPPFLETLTLDLLTSPYRVECNYPKTLTKLIINARYYFRLPVIFTTLPKGLQCLYLSAYNLKMLNFHEPYPRGLTHIECDTDDEWPDIQHHFEPTFTVERKKNDTRSFIFHSVTGFNK
jgi:hypothetical protein